MDDGCRCEPGAQGVQDRLAARQLVDRLDVRIEREPERVVTAAHLAQRLDVEEVVVVAEELAGAVRRRSDDRDPVQVRPERQDAVVLDEDQGPSSKRHGDGAFVDGEGHEVRRLGNVDERPLEQAQAELQPQRPRHGRVEDRFVQVARLDGPAKRLAVGRGARPLGIDPGAQGHRRDRRQVRAQAVLGR